MQKSNAKWKSYKSPLKKVEFTIMDANDNIVCELPKSEDAKKNAKLIAAAPEMLDALLKVASIMAMPAEKRGSFWIEDFFNTYGSNAINKAFER